MAQCKAHPFAERRLRPEGKDARQVEIAQEADAVPDGVGQPRHHDEIQHEVNPVMDERGKSSHQDEAEGLGVFFCVNGHREESSLLCK